jgi:hypothetical protein
MPNHCPWCQSLNINRSQRRGVLESVVFKLIHVRPYRCLSCDGRFFRWADTPQHIHSRQAAARIRSNFQGVISVLSGREKPVDRNLMRQRTPAGGPTLEKS